MKKSKVSIRFKVVRCPRCGFLQLTMASRSVKCFSCGLRKIGAPMDPELAVGAIAEEGAIYVDEEVARLERRLKPAGRTAYIYAA
ncbi:MAG: hypothetical protein LZ169_02075 [Thaumarchaeota archaeon]|nr:hypothetical protein [Candidatus Wolframiiraptor allenii]